jgi:hypothetical protein
MSAQLKENLNLPQLFAAHGPGKPVDLGRVVLVPIVRRGGGPDAQFLEEGLRSGDTTVTEVSESGSVNAVRIAHHGGRPLLIVDGEEIIGAKQNRVFNASFLIPSGATVELPVSCVERGRWRHQSPAFSSSGRTMHTSARASKLMRVSGSVKGGGGYDADQGKVWKDVDSYLTRTCVGSPTASLADGMDAQAFDVERRLATLALEPDQVGVAAVRGDRLLGMDLFGSAGLFKRAWPKIARGILSEVFGEPVASSGATAVVTHALTVAAHLPHDRRPAPGCGETLHASAGGLALGAIVLGADLYHAFVSLGG